MCYQMAELSIQPLSITISVLVFHLLLIPLCRGQSQLFGPSLPIVATVGHDIILPCRLKPAMDVAAKTLEWTRSDLNPRFVYVWRAGRDFINIKNPSYTGRTSLFSDELKNGNISLKLSKVKPTDEGRYRCYIPDTMEESFVELLVASDAASSPVISLAGIDRDRSGVVLQCEAKGWYPEPEVLWLDAEGNLLSAGPTETVRGPDDLYTVSSRVTVEKRHSNSFTCRVQQKDINQTRETHIHVPDDFFKVQSSLSPVTVGLAVGLSVCIVLILSLVFFMWTRRENIIKTQRNRCDETDGRANKKHRKSEKSEVQLFTEEEREREKLIKDENVPMQEVNKGKVEKKTNYTSKQQRSKEEKQRREEAEKRVKALKEELEIKKNEVQNKQAELQQLHEEKQRMESELQTLKEELENKNKQLETITKDLKSMSIFSFGKSGLKTKKEEAEREVETVKKQLETKETELQTKTEEVAEKQAELQQLQDENQRMETDLQTVEKELENIRSQLERNQADTVTQLHEEKKKLQKAEKEVKSLNNQLESMKKEVDQLSANVKKLEEEKQKSEDKQLQILEIKEKELQQEKIRREQAEKEVMTLQKKLEIKPEKSEPEVSELHNPEVKTQMDGSTGSPSHSSTTGRISMEVNQQDKYIRLKNQTNEDQQLKDWEIHVRVNNQRPRIYTFEYLSTLKGGDTVTIWPSGAGVRYNPPTDVVWFGQKFWSTGDKLLVTVFNRSGEPEASTELGTSQTSTPDSANGDIEIDVYANCVQLHNISSKEQELKDWEIHLQINNRKPNIHTFNYLRLKAKNTVTMWPSDKGVRHNPPTDVVWSGQKSWGTGDKLLVTVFNRFGELKASKEVGNSEKTEDSSKEHIIEFDLKDNCVCLHNISSKDQQLEDLKIYTKVNNREPVIYTMNSFNLEAGKTVPIKIEKYWSTGDKLLVTVLNHSGEELSMRKVYIAT